MLRPCERSSTRTPSARETNPPPPPAMAAAAAARKPRGTHKTGGTPFAAKTFNNISLKVTPLLTPDRLPGSKQGQYLTNVISLIKGAQSSIHIELQYIEASKGNGSLYDHLLQALADKIAVGKEVQLIVSANYAGRTPTGRRAKQGRASWRPFRLTN